MSWEEIQLRLARIGLLAPILPVFALMLAGGIILDRPPDAAKLLIGAGAMTTFQTVLVMVRIALLGAGPLIRMRLQTRLALLGGCAGLLIADGVALTFLLPGPPHMGYLCIGAGCGDIMLTVYLLAIRWFDHYEQYEVDDERLARRR